MAISIDRLETLLAMTEVPLSLEDVGAEDHGDHTLERLLFSTPDGTAVRGFLTRPSNISHPRPAILYAHAHGDRYDIGASELIDGRPALLDPPGPVLAREGM